MTKKAGNTEKNTASNKKVKKPVEAQIKKLDKARTVVEDAQREVIVALFEQCPSLKSVKLSAEQDYDDNNYFEVIHLVRVNGVLWDNEICDPNVEYLSDIDQDYEGYHSWLIEANLTINEFEAILKVLANFDNSYIKSWDDMEIKRNQYIKEEK